MLMFVIQDQPHSAGTDLRRKPVACLIAHGSILSRVGASGKPGAVHDERPMVSYIEGPSHFVRPTSKELFRLCDIVIAKYPKLGPRRSLRGLLDDELTDHFRNGFAWAFERLGFIARTEKPDTRYYVTHWANEAKDWLAVHRPGHCGDIG